MIEKTYVRSHDHCEVMVQYDGDRVSVVYAYSDNPPNVSGMAWLPAKNPVFCYANNPVYAERFIRDNFNLVDH